MEKVEGTQLNLNTFANGAVQEKFNNALNELLINLYDPNTEHKTKRKLTIELEFTTVETRDIAFVDIDTKVKLARPKKTSTSVLVGADMRGNIIASEYQNQIPGQTYMKEPNMVVDVSTGEVLSDSGEEQKQLNNGIQLVK